MTAKAGFIHLLEFYCEGPLIFYERCNSCPKFEEGCPDLELGKEILQGKKRLQYGKETEISEDCINVNEFKCLAPLSYFEKSRILCAHEGRCREEGLLLALLSKRKRLIHSKKEALEFPLRKIKIRKAKMAQEEKEKSKPL